MATRRAEVWKDIKFHAIDKNCVFTPLHIGAFMCELCGVNSDSVVLDPCCGPGALLTVAGTYGTNKLYGIEQLRDAYDEAINGNGFNPDNVICDSCFNAADFIRRVDPDVVLMNPPYNANGADVQHITGKKAKQDPTKGLAFVAYVLSIMTRGRLAVILPVQCGNNSNAAMEKVRAEILAHNTLIATFSLPVNLFVPAASVSTALYIFEAGKPHSGKTFMGNIPDDGFDANLRKGRYERSDGAWIAVHDEMLDLYENKTERDNKAVYVAVDASDSWLYSAHIHIDTIPTEEDLLRTVNEYLMWKINTAMTQSMNRRIEELRGAK